MLWATFCLVFFCLSLSGWIHVSVFGKLRRVSNASCGCGFSHSAFIYFGVAPEKQERSIWSRSHLVRWTVPQRAVCSAGFLAIRSPAPGSFFVFEDGGVLSRQRLVTALTTALQEVGLDPSPYKGHSFCIGTATAAAKVGLSDFLIQTLGRWKSSTFQLYVRTSRSRSAG